MRIDKFLKVSRLILRRSVANQVAEGGKVKINGNVAKPSRQVKVGDVVELQFSNGVFKFQVLKIQETVKKEQAETLYRVLVDENQ